MKKRLANLLILLCFAAAVIYACALRSTLAPVMKSSAEDPAIEHFTIGWTSYVGWAPWELAERRGIIKKWADRYGIAINVVQYGDYLDSVEEFSVGHLAGVTATLGDGLRSAARARFGGELPA